MLWWEWTREADGQRGPQALCPLFSASLSPLNHFCALLPFEGAEQLTRHAHIGSHLSNAQRTGWGEGAAGLCDWGLLPPGCIRQRRGTGDKPFLLRQVPACR